jgi:phosphomannomutase / phosphoglucomutase
VSRSIYKECDIRGIYRDDFDETTAHRIGRAVGTLRPHTRLVVGGDIRISTPSLKAALIEGLLRTPVHIIDIGVVPTPVFYDAIDDLKADAGVMVTASHNPAKYNGFKLVLGETPITPEQIEQIAELVRSEAFLEGVGSRTMCERSERYIDRVVAAIPATTAIRIVVDAGNGAAALVAPQLLERLGHTVEPLFCEVDGSFPHRQPNPAVKENLGALQARVIASGADLGVAFDGDGDRVAFVDGRGRVVSAEEALVVMVEERVRPGDCVVLDLKSASIVAQTVERLGGRAILERSGHAFIRTTFLRQGAVLAGEVSGHFFFRELGYDDALYAAAAMPAYLGRSGRSLAEAVEAIPPFQITPDLRIPWPEGERDQVLERVRQAFSDAELSTLDGIRAALPDGWVLARKSVTEPLITFRIEGSDAKALDMICRRLVKAIPELRALHPLFAESADSN